MKWVSTKPVNLNWQTFFVILDFFLIPTVIYAFLRIQKFRRYLLLVFIPEIAIAFTFVLPTSINMECEPEWYWIIYDSCVSLEVQVIGNLIYGGFTVFAIYLVRKWSKEWNKQFSDYGTIKLNFKK